MQFCPNCNNMLDITKSTPKVLKEPTVLNIQTPTTISMTDVIEEKSENIIDREETKELESIFDKLLKNERLSDNEIKTIENIGIERIMKKKIYTNLDKKQKTIVMGKINGIIDNINNSTNAYYHCKNCSYFKQIPIGTIVLNRINNNLMTKSTVNINKLKNKTHSKINAFTRNYICINEKCETNNKNSPKDKEAIMYRMPDGMQVYYTCTICNTVWKN